MDGKRYLNKEEMYAFGDELFKIPELGYKEFETKRRLTEYFESNGLKIKELGFETAFSVSIGKGKPHIGLIAELDAIPTLGHPYANKNDNYAAHSCGHSTQCTIMSHALVALNKQGIKKGTITLFFTPAEEYTDVEYRKKLIKQKKINYIGGKVNMLMAHQFDDVDMFIHLHTSNNNNYDMSINSSLGGFVYKQITFRGKAAHAAMCPEQGIDAMDMFEEFYKNMKQLRTAYPKEDMVRLHGIIDEGGQSVNSVPERIVYEMYARSINSETLLQLNKKVDKLAKDAAKKIGGKASIETSPGYLPLIQSDELNKVVNKCVRKYTKKVLYDEKSIAAGDVGDMSQFKPLIQFGYMGFKGFCHSKELCVDDYEKAYLLPCKVVIDSCNALLNDPAAVKKIKQYKPHMTFKQYEEYVNA